MFYQFGHRCITACIVFCIDFMRLVLMLSLQQLTTLLSVSLCVCFVRAMFDSMRAGPSCSKLIMSLASVSLKFQTLISQVLLFFIEKM